MKRRNFIKATSAAMTLPILVNGMGVQAIAKSSLFSSLNDDSDRVLVLIQLNGGNDGLNMIVPLDQYDKLANARSNILIPESSLLDVNDLVGFHPAMTGLKSLHDDGNLTIVQSVGYANQNRSHFRSTDIWNTASEANEFLTTGWLGRFFNEDHPTFPENYPNDDYQDPFAITIGSLVSETCQGIGGNYSLAINDPFNLNPLASVGIDEVPDTPYGEELTFLRTSIEQTNAYSEVIGDAATLGNTMATYPDGNRLGEQLRNVATLISGGLKTKVYIVSLGGFDTHANQTVDGNPLNGAHADLLNILSDAITAFQNDLKLLGLEERVMGMTFSEFGRRIRSNASFGTDHGDAAPLLVFGNCINPGFIGENPEIPDSPGVQDGVAMQHDFRDVYGSVLVDWFEVEEEKVKDLLYADFQYISILDPCGGTITPNDWPNTPSPYNPNKYSIVIDHGNFPNPFRERTNIEFELEKEGFVGLSVFNGSGQKIVDLVHKTLYAGKHQVKFDASTLPPGNYYYHIQTAGAQRTKLMVKVR
ncbi:MAG: DUF1501 domain-containing protein [Bacteroidetes bacterium]|jgi:uncharacterized protein (DUF1501 family)|nr:DUF1501 domain-containing protein [Bacteroidota bacterium]MDF1865548.1 DUF1501 domain-containing protein [Saprospiraceae bacterium]